MTGDSPVLDRPALQAALSDLRIESPDGVPFEEALAGENGWTLRFAERVADEYCGFLYLAATAGFEVTPSETVDKAWHLHLAWPHYDEVLCRRILGRPLEHRPGNGTVEDEARHRRQYEETLVLYESVFGKSPPEDIWPRPAAPAEPEPDRAGIGRFPAFRLVAAALLFGAATQLPSVPAMVLAMVGAGALFSILVGALRLEGRRRAGGGCGGSCATSGSDDGGGSCGSSCGGCGGD